MKRQFEAIATAADRANGKFFILFQSSNKTEFAGDAGLVEDFRGTRGLKFEPDFIEIPFSTLSDDNNIDRRKNADGRVANANRDIFSNAAGWISEEVDFVPGHSETITCDKNTAPVVLNCIVFSRRHLISPEDEHMPEPTQTRGK